MPEPRGVIPPRRSKRHNNIECSDASSPFVLVRKCMDVRRAHHTEAMPTSRRTICPCQEDISISQNLSHAAEQFEVVIEIRGMKWVHDLPASRTCVFVWRRVGAGHITDGYHIQRATRICRRLECNAVSFVLINHRGRRPNRRFLSHRHRLRSTHVSGPDISSLSVGMRQDVCHTPALPGGSRM